MSDGFPFLDILFFALIALFIILRLRAVLGRRTGNERKPFDPFGRGSERQGESQGTVIRMPGRRGPVERTDEDAVEDVERPARAAAPAREEGRTPEAAAARVSADPDVRSGLTQIKLADSAFDSRNFLSGAEAAYAMLVEAHAKGDTATLRPLLTDDVYDRFAAEIRTRLAAGKTQETRIVALETADIVSAAMTGRTAVVTVRFVSRQINATRSTTGELIAGDPETPERVTEEWRFTRNTRSRDPNWLLAETRAIA